MQYEIGQVLTIDNRGFEFTLNHWKKQIIPAIEKMIVEFDNLELGSFDQKIYNLVTAGNIKELEKIYREQIQKEADKLKVKALMKQLMDPEVIEAGFKSFRLACEQFLPLQNPHSFTGVNVIVAFEDCEIIDGTPVLNEKQIRERYQHKIENENQIEFLNHLHALKGVYDNVQDFIKQKFNPRFLQNVKIFHDESPVNFSKPALVFPGEEGYLEIDPYSIDYLKGSQ